MGHDPSDQADVVGGRGDETLAGEQQHHGVMPAEPLRQRDGADDDGQAYVDLGVAELGPLAGEPKVVPRQDGEAVAKAVPDRGNDRLPDLPAALERIERRFLLKRAREPACRPRAFAQVGPHTKGPAGVGHDGDPRLLLVTEAGEGGVQALDEPAPRPWRDRRSSPRSPEASP
jgi:hypothetical protein